MYSIACCVFMRSFSFSVTVGSPCLVSSLYLLTWRYCFHSVGIAFFFGSCAFAFFRAGVFKVNFVKTFAVKFASHY